METPADVRREKIGALTYNAMRLLSVALKANDREDAGQWQVKVCEAFTLVNAAWALAIGKEGEFEACEALADIEALEHAFRTRINSITGDVDGWITVVDNGVAVARRKDGPHA